MQNEQSDKIYRLLNKMKQTMNETLLFLLIKRKKTEDLNMDYYFDTTNVDHDDIMCGTDSADTKREEGR